ncbi:MAG: citrate lyase holo-[acyl-carrier protein] synthase, partial [Synergistaceae bacterium]|nr:citrate lyase holo-[acyl-carrier protein] synthase [Synergistaceae bacterium]
DPSSAAKAKDASVDIEEREEWGRALDIDILTRGGPISRASSGRAPRKCLLCPDEAKICARMTRHPAEELRERVKSLIRNFL